MGGLTLDTDVDVVLGLLGLSGILIGLGEGVERLEISGGGTSVGWWW